MATHQPRFRAALLTRLLVPAFTFAICAGNLGAAGSPVSSAAELVSVSASAYASDVLADHPQAYYALNDTTLVLNDLGPNRISGSYGTGVVRQAAPITAGVSAASLFRGGATYNPTILAATPATAALQPAALTLEAWVRIGGYNTTGKPLLIASYGRYVNGARYGLFLSQQNVLFYTQHDTGSAALNVFGNSELVPGGVYHCVATSDGRSLRVYVNGQLESTQSYAGSPAYAGSGDEGLYIGGARNSGLPPFDGTIAQVAVYARALGGSDVLNHFVVGQLDPILTEQASTSDNFVESIGVNTHFTQYSSIYGTHWAQARAALTSLGVRHIRDGLFAQKNIIQYAEYHDLGSAGIHGMFTTAPTETKATIDEFPKLVGPMFEAYESPNEEDETTDPNWAADCRTFQRNLYSWVKTNPATRSYPVVGPTLVSRWSYAKLGDVSAYLDYANIQDYLDPRNPGTPGWGPITPWGEYGSITYNLNLVTVTSGYKPVIASETGYGTIAGDPQTVDYRAQLRYIPRLLFEQFNHGIRLTYLYELLDKGGSAFWNNFGLVQTNFIPKPAFTALKSIIGALRDPGAAWTPGTLTYQIVGNTNNVHHTLMRKRNGSYIIAFWIETPSWDYYTAHGADTAVPNQSITVRTAGSFASATLSTLNESGDLSRASLAWSGHDTTFAVSDKISLLTLNP